MYHSTTRNIQMATVSTVGTRPGRLCRFSFTVPKTKYVGADFAAHHNSNLLVIHSEECTAAKLDEEASDIVAVRHTNPCVCNNKEIAAEILPAWHVADGSEVGDVWIA